MKVLFASSPIVGHFSPLAVAARILRNAGHTTGFCTGSEFREKLEVDGAQFFPLPAEVDFNREQVAALLGSFPPGTEQRAQSESV